MLVAELRPGSMAENSFRFGVSEHEFGKNALGERDDRQGRELFQKAAIASSSSAEDTRKKA